MNDHVVDRTLCAAAGCPCLGSISADTKGESDKWYCGVHFGKSRNLWPRITNELIRMKWLVQIIKELRAINITEDFDGFHQRANYQFNIHNRQDLKIQVETYYQYLQRLSHELRKSCLIDDRNGQNDLNSVG